jgi:short-subunit dehydrogenase
MNSFFANKTVAITGGSDGIGRALVETLLNSGANVSTCGRNADKLYQLQLANPGRSLHVIVADVSLPEDCRQFIQTTVQNFGSLDILINNAGTSMRALFADMNEDLAVIRKLMDTNFFGTAYCCKYALPELIKSKGIIVGVSSVAGFRGLPGRSGYSASKFAVNGFLESIRTELLDQGVHVMWVSPGFTQSNIRNAALDEKGKADAKSLMEEETMMSAEACAQHLLKAISSKKRNLILTGTGKRTNLVNKFFPGWADNLVHKFYFKDGKLVK